MCGYASYLREDGFGPYFSLVCQSAPLQDALKIPSDSDNGYLIPSLPLALTHSLTLVIKCSSKVSRTFRYLSINYTYHFFTSNKICLCYRNVVDYWDIILKILQQYASCMDFISTKHRNKKFEVFSNIIGDLVSISFTMNQMFVCSFLRIRTKIDPKILGKKVSYFFVLFCLYCWGSEPRASCMLSITKIYLQLANSFFWPWK